MFISYLIKTRGILNFCIPSLWYLYFSLLQVSSKYDGVLQVLMFSSFQILFYFYKFYGIFTPALAPLCVGLAQTQITNLSRTDFAQQSFHPHLHLPVQTHPKPLLLGRRRHQPQLTLLRQHQWKSQEGTPRDFSGTCIQLYLFYSLRRQKLDF